MIIDTTQTKIERGNWIAAQSTCPNCGKIHDIMNFATADSFNGDCDVCGTYVCTIVYASCERSGPMEFSFKCDWHREMKALSLSFLAAGESDDKHRT